MMWTKILIGFFKYSKKNIRTVCYTPLLITKIVIEAIKSFCVIFIFSMSTPFPSDALSQADLSRWVLIGYLLCNCVICINMA